MVFTEHLQVEAGSETFASCLLCCSMMFCLCAIGLHCRFGEMVILHQPQHGGTRCILIGQIALKCHRIGGAVRNLALDGVTQLIEPGWINTHAFGANAEYETSTTCEQTGGLMGDNRVLGVA